MNNVFPEVLGIDEVFFKIWLKSGQLMVVGYASVQVMYAHGKAARLVQSAAFADNAAALLESKPYYRTLSIEY